MTRIETLADAMLNGDSLLLRSLLQDFIHEHPHLAAVPKPRTGDVKTLAAAASLLELLAIKLGQQAPSWTNSIGALAEPIFLLKAAANMKRLRELCIAESPEPLRKRGFYATPNYLEFA
jgi:hypothetical protein